MAEEATGFLGTGVSSETIRFAIMLFAVAVSIFWNFLNWKRTNKLDALSQKNSAAIRFEAVHGDSLNEIVKLLDGVMERTNVLSVAAVNIDDCKKSFNDDIKSLIISAEYKVAVLATDLLASPLAGEVGETGVWTEISNDGGWDETWMAYSNFTNSSGMAALVKHLSELTVAVQKYRSLIVSARANENNVK